MIIVKTGIVRRMDELGRIAIPKEIRRVLNLEPETPLEFFVDKEKQEITFRKYPSEKLDNVLSRNPISLKKS